MLTLPAAKSLADFTALAVAANVVLVEFVAVDNCTMPAVDVDADVRRALATVPLLKFDAFRLVSPLPDPEKVPPVTVPLAVKLVMPVYAPEIRASGTVPLLRLDAFRLVIPLPDPLKDAADTLPENNPFPSTCNFSDGPVVPSPRFPADVIRAFSDELVVKRMACPVVVPSVVGPVEEKVGAVTVPVVVRFVPSVSIVLGANNPSVSVYTITLATPRDTSSIMRLALLADNVLVTNESVKVVSDTVTCPSATKILPDAI